MSLTSHDRSAVKAALFMEPFSYAPNGTVDFNPPVPAMLYGTQLAEEVTHLILNRAIFTKTAQIVVSAVLYKQDRISSHLR